MVTILVSYQIIVSKKISLFLYQSNAKMNARITWTLIGVIYNILHQAQTICLVSVNKPSNFIMLNLIISIFSNSEYMYHQELPADLLTMSKFMVNLTQIPL